MTQPRPLLAISCRDLEAGPKSVRESLPHAWLSQKLAEGEEASIFSASHDGEVQARITPTGGDNFLVQGHVRATVDTRCARCDSPTALPIDAEMTLLLVPRAHDGQRAPKGKHSKESEGEFEFDSDEADIATYDGETVVLDDLVREALLLELPMAPLCSDDCPGMAADPAVEQKLAAARVDPRLAPLAGLRDALAQNPAARKGRPDSK